MKGHLKYMLIGGGAILALLLAVGVDVRDALPWAFLLACPLMMIGMMFMMNRGGAKSGSNHDHGLHSDDHGRPSDAEVGRPDAERGARDAWASPAREGRGVR